MNIHNSSCVFWLVVLFDNNSVSLICFIVSGEYLYILHIYTYVYLSLDDMSRDNEFWYHSIYLKLELPLVGFFCLYMNKCRCKTKNKKHHKTNLLWYTSLRCWSHFLHSAKSDEYKHCFGLFFWCLFCSKNFQRKLILFVKKQRKGKKTNQYGIFEMWSYLPLKIDFFFFILSVYIRSFSLLIFLESAFFMEI